MIKGEFKPPIDTFAGKFVEAARGFPAANRAATEAAALHMTTAIRQEINQVTHGSSRLSNFGKSGRKVGARYDVRHFEGQDRDLGKISATGPLQLFEWGTEQHLVVPKAAGGSRRSRANKVLKARQRAGAYGQGRVRTGLSDARLGPMTGTASPFYRVVLVRGMKAQHPFEKGMEKSEGEVLGIYQREHMGSIAKAMASHKSSTGGGGRSMSKTGLGD